METQVRGAASVLILKFVVQVGLRQDFCVTVWREDLFSPQKSQVFFC